MAWLISWQVKGNPQREKIVSLEKTADDYKKHLERFAGDKLQYFEKENLED